MQYCGRGEAHLQYSGYPFSALAADVIHPAWPCASKTTRSIVFMYSVTLLGNTSSSPVYSVPSTGTGAAKGQFVAGSGEAQSLPPLILEEVGLLDFSESQIAA